MSNSVNRPGQDTDFSCKPRQKSQPLHSYTYQSADDRPTGQSLVKRVSYQRYRRSDDPRDPSNRLRLTENRLVYAYVLISTHQTTSRKRVCRGTSESFRGTSHLLYAFFLARVFVYVTIKELVFVIAPFFGSFVGSVS